MFDPLVQAIVNLKRDEVAEWVKTMAESGEDPNKILEACRRGMTTVGNRFQEGNFYLAELMLSAEIFKQAMIFLEPYLAERRRPESVGKVLLATLKGDIHDLGKNLLGFLLKAQGFEVHDMGVDVPPDLVIAKAKEISPDFVGFSALMTPVFEKMKEAAEGLRQKGLRDRCKLMIGGGVTTPETKEYVGADFQTLDVMEGVTYCVNNLSTTKGEVPCQKRH